MQLVSAENLISFVLLPSDAVCHIREMSGHFAKVFQSKPASKNSPALVYPTLLTVLASTKSSLS